MAAIATTVLALVALLGLCTAFAAIGVYFAYAIPFFIGRAASGFSTQLDGVAEGFEAKSRHEQIEAELQARRNNRRSGKGVDRVIVEAAEATQAISIGLKMVKEATATCCEIQLLTADMQGAEHMEEIEWNPVCANLRQNVVETMDVALDHLDAYPMMNRKVIKQSMVLRGFQRVCEDCELLKYRRQDAPPLCRPAALMTNQPCENGDRERPRN